MEKKVFVEPEVTKVEFEFSDVIAASGGCIQSTVQGAGSLCALM